MNDMPVFILKNHIVTIVSSSQPLLEVISVFEQLLPLRLQSIWEFVFESVCLPHPLLLLLLPSLLLLLSWLLRKHHPASQQTRRPLLRRNCNRLPLLLHDPRPLQPRAQAIASSSPARPIYMLAPSTAAMIARAKCATATRCTASASTPA